MLTSKFAKHFPAPTSILFVFGVIHKPCGHGRGEGVCQMSILRYKPVKLSTKRGRVSKMYKILSTWLMDDPFYECQLKAF